MRTLLTAVLAAALLCLPVVAQAHGGGGGGGGGHVVYIPVFTGGNGPAPVPEATTGDYANIHTVAIISSVGQNMVVGDPGLFRSRVMIGISDLKLDDFVVATLK